MAAGNKLLQNNVFNYQDLERATTALLASSKSWGTQHGEAFWSTWTALATVTSMLSISGLLT